MAGFAEFLEQWLPHAPARLLEVGAGRGDLTARLRGRGHEVVAIDPHAHDVADVEAVGVEAVGDTLGTFDAVVAQRSLHHVEDLGAAMRSIAGVLDPGGVLIVEDFGWDLVDDATGRWMHAEARRLGHEVAGASFQGWMRRFRTEHADLATFPQLRAALDAHFHEWCFEWIVYLAEEYLDADPDAREREAAMIERGEIHPAAYRYVGANVRTGR